MRLQVFLSHNGVCSRREAMDVVKSGRVSLNGQVAREPSTPVDPVKDKISVDGKAVGKKSYQYVLLNKPAGYVTTTEDPHAERKVLDLLPEELKHLVPVGRLDKDTEGLLLLTNDGNLAFQLSHPKFNIDKTYFVRVRGKLSIEKIHTLEKGIVIDDKKTAPCRIEEVKLLSDKSEFLMTIHEGRKRQIRVMLGRVGYPVLYLQRLRQGSLTLGDLKTGKWRMLNEQEINQLKKI